MQSECGLISLTVTPTVIGIPARQPLYDCKWDRGEIDLRRFKFDESVRQQANVLNTALIMATFSLLTQYIWKWMQKSLFLSIFVAAIALVVLYGLAKVHRNLIVSPLRPVPGPKFFALTRWRLAYEDYRGTRTRCINNLHKQYGDVVRVGPNELSFNSLSALKSIYGAGSGFQRDKFYRMFDAYGRQVMFSFAFSVDHRGISPAS